MIIFTLKGAFVEYERSFEKLPTSIKANPSNLEVIFLDKNMLEAKKK